MLESPHQNRLIMENFDFKETFFSQEREGKREEGESGNRGVVHLVCGGARADPIPTVIVIMLWGRGGEGRQFPSAYNCIIDRQLSLSLSPVT